MYKVTIEKLKEKDDKSYKDYEEIYSQKVDDLDLLAVINAVNSKEKEKALIKDITGENKA